MALEAGSKVGQYEVLSSLGKGGMGEVYRARDDKLDREVALKILPAELTSDADRTLRFEREARVLASLNHPHIGGIYGFEDSSDVRALVLELVEGPTLAERIAQGPLPQDEALDIASQIAKALEAAHDQGIIHRDLKPANVKVREDGTVKVLDFGLAKALANERPADDSQSPTMTAAATRLGVIIGTAAYMSPEQARGKPVDRGADAWAFGAVLFEMLTGRPAFRGNDVPATLAAVLRDEPDWSMLPASVTPTVRRTLEACLHKDPRDRLRDLGAARLALDGAFATAPESNDASRSQRSPSWLRLAATAAVALTLGVAGTLLLRPAPDSPTTDLSRYVFTPISRTPATERTPAFSPDGKTLAYTANIRGVDQVMTRALGAPEAAQITQLDQSATSPFWSPDGERIYFTSARQLWAVGSSGGVPSRLLANVTRAHLHPDGQTFSFLREAEYWIGTTESEPTRIPLPESIKPLPTTFGFSPDGSRWGLFSEDEIWIFDYPSWRARTLVAPSFSREAGGARSATWMPDSRRVVLASRSRLSILDTEKDEERVVLASSQGIWEPTVAPDGQRIAYRAGAIQWSLVEVSLQDGRARPLEDTGGVSYWPDWAPSGSHYLYASGRSGLWTVVNASAEGGFTRVVAELEFASSLTRVRWAPDGVRFSARGFADARPVVWLGNALSGQLTALEQATTAVWAPDGQWLTYGRISLAPEQVFEVRRLRPGSTEDTVIATYRLGEGELPLAPVAWSPREELVLVVEPWSGQYALVTPDWKVQRSLTSRPFERESVAFSNDGRHLLGILRNTTGQGSPWQLYAIDIETGEEEVLVDLDFPVDTGSVAGISLHPDGDRFITSIAKWPHDIWMLEGFEP